MRRQDGGSGARVGWDAPTGELTRSSDGTLHGQLYRTLAGLIRNGQAKPGDRLPTEAELMEAYSVSRSTARRALDDLRREKLVERVPGRGSFVAYPKMEAAIPHLHSITEEIRQLGFRAGSRLISRRTAPAEPKVARQFGTKAGATLLLLDRLRTADDRPFYLSRSALNSVAFPDLLNQDYEAPDLSLLQVFERVAEARVSHVAQWLCAVGAPPAVAAHLDVEPGVPLLQLERVLFVGNRLPIESVVAWFIGETYKYYSELSAPGA